MLLLDEAELNEAGESVGKYTVKGDEFFLQGHFPGNPIVPGVIQCEMIAQAAVLLATAPKSNSVIEGIGAAWADVKAGKSGNFPRCLQNVHADSTGGAQGQNYKYPHAYPNHWVKQQYLPDELKNVQYYHYGDNKVERAAAQYWEAIKG